MIYAETASGTVRRSRASPIAALPRVIERRTDTWLTTVDVDPTEVVLAGHFPGFAIFPGVCLVECAHQSALIALAECGEPGAEPELAALETVRFLNPVYPGDQVLVELSVLPLDDGWRCPARVLVRSAGSGGQPVEAVVLKLRYRAGRGQ